MTHVDWRPYPKNLPEYGGIYTVTAIDFDGCRLTALGIYDLDLDYWNDELGYRLDVIAWAEPPELPEPYQPEGDEKCSGT